MLDVAYFSPLPPVPAGIADYSMELLSPLSELVSLTLFVEKPDSVEDQLRSRFSVEPLATYPTRRWDFDLALYHMGNSGFYHAAIHEMAIRYPGVVVLHEVVLHDFTSHVTIGSGDYAAYAREMGYELGSPGYDLAWQIRLGRRPRPIHSVPFSKRLIDRSLGVIVHSQSAAELVLGQSVDRPIAVISQLAVHKDVASLRHRLSLSDQVVTYAATGLVNANKRIDLALDAFARLNKVEKDVFFLIVGGAHTDVNLPGLISQRHLKESVHWTGRVASLEEFVGWTASADVVISLRHPTLGETSSAAVRAMAAGKPLIVYDQGWYGELPDEICLKVPPLDPDALFEAMVFLARHHDARKTMGKAAADFAKRYLDPRRTAILYAHFLRRVVESCRIPEGETLTDD